MNSLFGDVEGELERSEDVRARTRVEIVNSAVVLAAQLTNRFSLGVAAVQFDATMDSFSAEYAQDDERFFEEIAGEVADRSYRERVEGIRCESGDRREEDAAIPF